MHEIHLDPRPYADTAEEALTTIIAEATTFALAGARIESIAFFPARDAPFWHATAKIKAPGKPADWKPLDLYTGRASVYAHRVLFRNPLGGTYPYAAMAGLPEGLLRNYPTPAEGMDTHLQEMMTGLGIAFAAAVPLRETLTLVNLHESLDREDLKRADLWEIFDEFDRMAAAADPKRSPLENLHAGITRELAGLDLRLLPAGTDHPEEPDLEAAKGIFREIMMVGAMLPGHPLHPPTLADLQRYRDQAPARYAAILASASLTDHDRAFLAEHPPGGSAWFDVLLGRCEWDGRKAMAFLYAGFLAFLEELVIKRAFEDAGDTIIRGNHSHLIGDPQAAWRGFRHGRFTWAST